MVRQFVAKVFVEPVREGRLRDVAWPIGLRPIVTVALSGYVVAVALVLFAAPIRSSFELFTQMSDNVPFPRAIIWIVVVLTSLSMTLLQTGALHARAWLRWTVTGVTILILFFIAGSADFTSGGRGATVAAAVCGVALIVLVALRGPRTFWWPEFAITAALMFGTITISVAEISSFGSNVGLDFTPLMVVSVLGALASLAMPAALASGAAVAELAVTSATWLAAAVRDTLGGVVVVVLLTLVTAWRLVDVVPQIIDLISDFGFEIVTMVGAAAFLVVLTGAWILLKRLSAHRAPPTINGLVGALSRTSLPVAVFLIPVALTVLPLLIVSTLPFIGLPDDLSNAVAVGASPLFATNFYWVGTLATGVVLLALSVGLARRGVASTPELFAAIGLTSVSIGTTSLLGTSALWSAESLSLVATLICFAVGVWILLTRRATVGRLTAISVALLAAALFAHPEWLTDPLAIVLASATAASLLVGFTWTLLTGFASANSDSPRYPRPSRVMLLLSNTLFATTVLAYVAISHDKGAGFDLASFADVGLRTFGTALIACTLLVAVREALADGQVD